MGLFVVLQIFTVFNDFTEIQKLITPYKIYISKSLTGTVDNLKRYQ